MSPNFSGLTAIYDNKRRMLFEKFPYKKLVLLDGDVNNEYVVREFNSIEDIRHHGFGHCHYSELYLVLTATTLALYKDRCVIIKWK